MLTEGSEFVIEKKWKFEHIVYSCPHSQNRKARGESRERRVLFSGCNARIYAKYSHVHEWIELIRVNLNHSGHDTSEQALYMTTPKLRKFDESSDEFQLLVKSGVSNDNLLEHIRSAQDNPYISKKDVINAKASVRMRIFSVKRQRLCMRRVQMSYSLMVHTV